MILLRPHSQNKTQNYLPLFQRLGVGKFIFRIKAASWNQSPRDKDPKKNWQLWEQDVVEIFLQKRDSPQNFTAPYTELEVSTLGDAFVLQIQTPRKVTWTPLNFNWNYEAKRISEVEYEITIEIPALEEKHLWYVGIFASLGVENKEYFSLKPNRGMNANFHLPQYFIPLDCI